MNTRKRDAISEGLRIALDRMGVGGEVTDTFRGNGFEVDYHADFGFWIYDQEERGVLIRSEDIGAVVAFIETYVRD